jgi:hypothetical protein
VGGSLESIVSLSVSLSLSLSLSPSFSLLHPDLTRGDWLSSGVRLSSAFAMAVLDAAGETKQDTITRLEAEVPKAELGWWNCVWTCLSCHDKHGDNNLQFQTKIHNCSFKPKITNFNFELQFQIKLRFQHKITNCNFKLQFRPNCNFKPNWF